MEMFERVRVVAERCAGSHSRLAERLQLPQRTFAGYLNLKRQSNLWPLLPKILEIFPTVSREWLYFGEGEMLVSENLASAEGDSPQCPPPLAGFFTRILALIDQCTGGNQAAFAARVGEAQSTLHGYLSLDGQVRIKAKTLVRILEEFNVDANWLLLGEGEMFRKAGAGGAVSPPFDPLLHRIQGVKAEIRAHGGTDQDVLQAIKKAMEFDQPGAAEDAAGGELKELKAGNGR